MNKKSLSKILGVGAATLAIFGLAGTSYASAQVYGTSTVVSTVTGLTSDLGQIIAAVLGVILGLWAALVGAGWGIGKFKKYIAGRKV